MPRSTEQNLKIRSEKIKIISESAMRLFAEKGYHVVSIAEIAKDSGISKGLMYNYFSSKEELLQKIIFSGLDDIFEHLDLNHNNRLTKEQLETYINITFSHLISNTGFWKLFLNMLMQPSVQAALRSKLLDYSMPLFDMLESYFKDQGKENPELEVVFFSSLLSGVITKFLGSPDNYPLEKIKHRVIQIYK